MRKWIVFRANKRQPGWEDRRFQHTQSLTKILCEYLDSSDSSIPDIGYRPYEFIKVEQFDDGTGASTHYRVSDWEVTKVETYTPDIPMGEFDMVVICYCQYSPINSELIPMPERQVSLHSFGGDKKAYQDYLESKNKQHVEA